MNLSIAKLAVVVAVLMQGASFAASVVPANHFEISEATGLSTTNQSTQLAKCGAGACGGKEVKEAGHKCATKKCAGKEAAHKCATKKCAGKEAGHKCATKKCAAKEAAH